MQALVWCRWKVAGWVAHAHVYVSSRSHPPQIYGWQGREEQERAHRPHEPVAAVRGGFKIETNNEWGSVGQSRQTINFFNVCIYIPNLQQYETRNRLVDWGSAEARVPGKAHNTLVGTRHFKVRGLVCVYIYTYTQA